MSATLNYLLLLITLSACGGFMLRKLVFTRQVFPHIYALVPFAIFYLPFSLTFFYLPGEFPFRENGTVESPGDDQSAETIHRLSWEGLRELKHLPVLAGNLVLCVLLAFLVVRYFILFGKKRKAVPVTADKMQNSIDNLSGLTIYFEHNADKNESFIPELQIYTTVTEFIFSKRQQLSDDDFQTIAALYNKIADAEHHDGTGWFDFKLRLNHFFSTFGYTATWNETSGKLTLQKLTDSVRN